MQEFLEAKELLHFCLSSSLSPKEEDKQKKKFAIKITKSFASLDSQWLPVLSASTISYFELPDGTKYGTCIVYYHPNGKKAAEIPFVNGKVEGKVFVWHPSGNIYLESEIKGGKYHGSTTFWGDNKFFLMRHHFRDGVLFLEERTGEVPGFGSQSVGPRWHLYGRNKDFAFYVCKKWHQCYSSLHLQINSVISEKTQNLYLHSILFVDKALSFKFPGSHATYTKWHNNGQIESYCETNSERGSGRNPLVSWDMNGDLSTNTE